MNLTMPMRIECPSLLMHQSFVSTGHPPPPHPPHTHTPTGMGGLMTGVITFWMSPQCRVNAGIMILLQYSGDYSGGTSRRKSVFYAYFTGVMAVFYQSTNDKISREQDSDYNRNQKWEKFYKYLYSSYLSIFISKLKLDN